MTSTFLDMKYKYLLFVFLYDLWLIFGMLMIGMLRSLETEPKVSEDRQRLETRILSPFHDEYI